MTKKKKSWKIKHVTCSWINQVWLNTALDYMFSSHAIHTLRQQIQNYSSTCHTIHIHAANARNSWAYLHSYRWFNLVVCQRKIEEERMRIVLLQPTLPSIDIYSVTKENVMHCQLLFHTIQTKRRVDTLMVMLTKTTTTTNYP